MFTDDINWLRYLTQNLTFHGGVLDEEEHIVLREDPGTHPNSLTQPKGGKCWLIPPNRNLFFKTGAPRFPVHQRVRALLYFFLALTKKCSVKFTAAADFISLQYIESGTVLFLLKLGLEFRTQNKKEKED
jgi:hypothetical protein